MNAKSRYRAKVSDEMVTLLFDGEEITAWHVDEVIVDPSLMLTIAQAIIDCYERPEKVEEFKNKRGLLPGDEVYWTDIDGGICSGVYKIVEFTGINTVLLRNEAGSEIEAFMSELS